VAAAESDRSGANEELLQIAARIDHAADRVGELAYPEQVAGDQESSGPTRG